MAWVLPPSANLRSSGGEVPQARTPCTPTPAPNTVRASSWPDSLDHCPEAGGRALPVRHPRSQQKGAPQETPWPGSECTEKQAIVAQAAGCDLAAHLLGVPPAHPPKSSLSCRNGPGSQQALPWAQNSFSKFPQTALHLPILTVPTPECPLCPCAPRLEPVPPPPGSLLRSPTEPPQALG